jgi:uncharacterized protein YjbJ (UPF0337 family)
MSYENIAAGKWKEIKGEIQKRWGNLTNDEIEKSQGDFNSLVGLLQKKFGYAQEEAREVLNSFLKRFSEPVLPTSKPAGEREDLH